MREIAAQWGQPGFGGKAKAIDVLDSVASGSPRAVKNRILDFRTKIEALPEA